MTAVLGVVGPAAPPRANGELVFAEPWESRAFGMAVTLAEAGLFTWDEFRDSLVARIAAWEADHAPGEEYRYYRCWLAALEDRVVAAGALDAAAVAERSARLVERPAGHDHADDRHGHGHRRRGLRGSVATAADCVVDEEHLVEGGLGQGGQELG